MNQTFERNLNLLEAYDPALAQRLRNYFPMGRVEVFATPDGKFKSLRLYHEGKSMLLHSGRDPIREAIRLTESMKETQIFNLIVFGCGLMYHIYQLVDRYKATLRNLVIIEKEIEIVYTAFVSIDLSPFLLTKTTFFLVDVDHSELRDFMNRLLTPFILDGVTLVEHTASYEVHEGYYDGIRKVIDESLQGGEILLRTKVQLGGMIQENIIRNVPMLLNNPNASALKGLLSQIPAFVIGAGPSLDRNIEQLMRVGDRAVIIATDTVFNKLRKLGIEPHLVVTTDPTPLNARHFTGLEELQETILVFSPSVYYKILRELKGTKVSVPLPASRFLRTLTGVLGDQSYMKTGTNVGQTCFNLAGFLGCDPIVLVGMDLSFPAQGGTTHASGTAWRRNITLSQTPGKMMVELISDKPELEEFDPILITDNQGGKVATSKFWLAYLRSLEEEVRVTPAKVINATEGGARVEGTEVRPLAQVIDEFCHQDTMARSTLQMSVGFFFGLYGDEGKNVLREGSEILNTAIEESERGLQKVNVLDTVARSPDANLQVMRELMDEILAIHKEVVQDHKVYIVLDEAADQVLTPFLRRENRPFTDEPTLENVRKTIDRYQNYFTEMKRVCETFQKIMRETLEDMEESTSDSPFSF